MNTAWDTFKEGASLFGLPMMMFLMLLVFVLWDSRQREKRSSIREDKLIDVIGTLSEDVKERLSVIETHLEIRPQRR